MTWYWALITFAIGIIAFLMTMIALYFWTKEKHIK